MRQSRIPTVFISAERPERSAGPMDFVTGYREQLLDFSELMFHWYRKLLRDQAAGNGDDASALEAWRRQGEVSARRLPTNGANWTLHVIRNTCMALTVENPAQQVNERFYSDDVLTVRDLRKYVSLINLEEEDEEELALQHDHFIHINCLLYLTNEDGYVLGVDFTLIQEAHFSTSYLAMKAYNLLLQAINFPMCGTKPQRPHLLTIGDEDIQRVLKLMVVKLDVWSTSVTYQCCLPRRFTFCSTTVKACHVCKKRSFEATLTVCDQCAAVLYCSTACQQLDWRKSPEDGSHRYWCQQLRCFMERGEELADFPFNYTAEVTSPTFDRELFLSGRGLCSGYWLCESMLVSAARLSAPRSWCGDDASTFFKVRNPFMPLRKEGAILLQGEPNEPPSMRSPFVTWQTYYQWRGLDLDSPVATLLSYPLTIYHIITSLVPQHFPELNILNKQSLKIHILKAQKQFEIWMVFWELAVLLPHITFEIHIVDEGLPTLADEQQFNLLRKNGGLCVLSPSSWQAGEKSERVNIRVRVCARAYHRQLGARPDLVIGFNAGFGLSGDWLRTLPCLQSLRVPAYFTECSEYGCATDGQIMGSAAGGSTSSPLLNPFRSPLRIVGNDNNLPWYSNAFLFHLVYKVNPGSSRQAPAPGPMPRCEPQTPTEELPGVTRRKKDKKRCNLRRRK